MKNISKAFNSNQEKEQDRKIPAAAKGSRKIPPPLPKQGAEAA
jgi:hypothetical protein